MSSRDSQDDPPPDSAPVLSREALTPRGGFMARPGLKPPPRHAVVVRGGDAPLAETIPVARSSFPPAAPSDPPGAELAPVSLSEKATLRAIPAARVPRISTVVFDEPAPSPRASEPAPRYVALESAPPPSDAPLVQSIPPVSSGPRSGRRGSRWPVFAAGAAGLILGLVSVLATRGGDDVAPPLAAAQPATEPAVEASSPPLAPAAAAPSASARPSEVKAAVAASARPAVVAVKKSIF